MSTYELQEKLKQLEKEIQELLEEQNHYLRIIIKRKQEELSNTEELEKTPICISEYVRKHIHSLSKDKDNLSEEQLNQKINQCIDYLCNSGDFNGISIYNTM
jgi:excinuclease UvrABC helicase subunit UvrB